MVAGQKNGVVRFIGRTKFAEGSVFLEFFWFLVFLVKDVTENVVSNKPKSNNGS